MQNPQVIHIYIRTKDIKEDYFMISTYQGSGFHQALIQYANLNKVAVQSGDSSSKAKGKVSKIAWMLGLILIAIVGVISFVPNDMPQGNNIVDEPRFLDTIPAIDYTLGDVLTNEPVIEGDRVKLISNFIEVDFSSADYDANKNISIKEAAFNVPTYTMYSLWDNQPITMESLLKVDVDIGTPTGALSKMALVKIPIQEYKDQGYDVNNLLIMASYDDKTWTHLPYTIEGEFVIVETQHFSLITVLGAVAAGGFVYYESESILPNLMHPDGPFISYKAGIKGRGYYLSWSTKLKGLDKNGFKDTKLYKSEVTKLCKLYGIEAPLQAVFFDSENYKHFQKKWISYFICT